VFVCGVGEEGEGAFGALGDFGEGVRWWWWWWWGLEKARSGGIGDVGFLVLGGVDT